MGSRCRPAGWRVPIVALALLLACLASLEVRAAPPTQPAPEPVPVPEVDASPLAPPPPRELVIATKPMPPFVIKGGEGEWSGLSVSLWRAIAHDLHLRYRIVETDLKSALQGVAGGRYDMAVGAFSITPAREQTLDFTQPYYTTGLAIAVANHNPGFLGWVAVAERFFSWQFLSVILSLIFLLLCAGTLVWLFERRRNPQFGGHWYDGIGDGMWWSAVTMTTVGYGDKSPITLAGRIVGLLWMLIALLVLASFTAAITSALTVGTITGAVKGFNDLHGVRVGVVRDTGGAEVMQAERYVPRPYDSLQDGLQAVAAGNIDAFVYDAPTLIYTAKRKFGGKIDVLPDRFMRQDYGFALQQGSKLREAINVDLLKRIRSDAWQSAVQRYLGPEEAAASLP